MRIAFQIHRLTILKQGVSFSAAREQESIEKFPPYELAVERGEEIYNKTFANGKSFKDCFGEDGSVRGQYPYWDKERGMVVTMELAINECLEIMVKPLKYKKGAIADVKAYVL